MPPNLVASLKKQAEKGMSQLFFRGQDKTSSQPEHEAAVIQLHQKIGEQLTNRGDFFHKRSGV